jgi:hypothetical protein
MKLVMQIKMYLNKTNSKVHTGENLSDAFPIQNGVKQREGLLACFRICHQEGLELNGTYQFLAYAGQKHEYHKEKYRGSVRG